MLFSSESLAFKYIIEVNWSIKWWVRLFKITPLPSYLGREGRGEAQVIQVIDNN